ncbi:molybdenum cofactor guanylyltransferase [Aquimarina sp. AD10]|uniref:molybdenum cofactor guanylyltransferase n=1 Tax=Aquimarina sp. AD10 TaxID=1714849 RepID=UPI000E49502C|nr:molybdenum cofactor guanylyltransferase [Aquimarina sp. AD10]AXT62341.1 molybdenum cofactor guanylyltransferase [Aquimarina sp. AD10]RKM90463.1 molybdenum cofactor guanylyltransferase [Aquimarina sp. AD10]
MNNEENITGIILAGGKSSRMGSDKGLLVYNNKTFVEHIIEAMQPLVSEIIIVSNTKDYDQFAHKRVEDIIPDSGPIAGIHTGLTHSNTPSNFVVSCDVPLINRSLLEKLSLQDKEIYDVVQFEDNGKTIPLIALYKKRCAKKCIELLDANEKRLRKLVSALEVKTISILEKERVLVANINTVDDFKVIKNAVNH